MAHMWLLRCGGAARGVDTVVRGRLWACRSNRSTAEATEAVKKQPKSKGAALQVVLTYVAMICRFAGIGDPIEGLRSFCGVFSAQKRCVRNEFGVIYDHFFDA